MSELIPRKYCALAQKQCCQANVSISDAVVVHVTCQDLKLQLFLQSLSPHNNENAPSSTEFE